MAKPGQEIAELAVAVSRLVEVHEVHVDLGPRKIEIVLGVQMQQRLPQRTQPGDPHLGGRERVHPGDHTDAAVVRVRVEAGPADRVRRGQHRLLHDADRDGWRGGESGHDLGRLLLDHTQRVLAVEALAAGQEPHVERGRLHVVHLQSVSA
jgi:hypothetical protein